MRHLALVASALVLAGGGFLTTYSLLAGEDQVGSSSDRVFKERACDGCPISTATAEVQARAGSTLFVFGSGWPAAAKDLDGTISLDANDVHVVLEPSADGFLLAAATRGGSDLDPAAVAAGLRDGYLLLNLRDDVLTAPVTFALEVGTTGGGGRIPRAGRLHWKGSGPPVPENTPTGAEPEPETPEPPEDFVKALAAAFREGDTAFLVERLNPAVIAVYGVEQCTASIQPDPTRSFTVTSVSELEPYVYNPDGLAKEISGGAYTVLADVVAGGATATGRELHFAPVGRRLTWFTDCGQPLAAD